MREKQFGKQETEKEKTLVTSMKKMREREQEMLQRRETERQGEEKHKTVRGQHSQALAIYLAHYPSIYCIIYLSIIYSIYLSSRNPGVQILRCLQADILTCLAWKGGGAIKYVFFSVFLFSFLFLKNYILNKIEN